MTVNELIKALKALPKEARNQEVVFCDPTKLDAEDCTIITEVKGASVQKTVYGNGDLTYGYAYLWSI